MTQMKDKPVVKLHEVAGGHHSAGPEVTSTAKPPRGEKVVPVDPEQKSAEAGEPDIAVQDRITEQGSETATPIHEALDRKHAALAVPLHARIVAGGADGGLVRLGHA